MILYVSVESPYRWCLVDRRRQVIDSGTSETLDAIDTSKKPSQVAGVIPGTRVTLHTVSLPARTRSKALASAPYALEEKLATDIEDLVFTLLDWKAGQHATVSVTEAAYIDYLENEFASSALGVDAFVPEFLMVPLHPQAQITVARASDDSFVLRTGRFTGMVLDPGTLEFWWQSLADPHVSIATNDKETARQLIEWGGTAVREWDIGKEFPAWLTHDGTPLELVNIRPRTQTDHQSSTPTWWSRVAILLFFLGLLAKVGLDLYDNYRLYHQDKNLDQEIVSVFQQAFPEVKRIVNPRLQMTQKVRELRAGALDAGEFQLLMSSVAQAVPRASATLEEVSFRDNTLTITCTTKDFAGLDQLKQRFADDQRIRAELISSGSRDNRVSARFALRRV